MYLRFIGSVLLVLLLAGPVLAKPISIKIVQPATHSTTENRVINYLVKLIEERSGGRVHFERVQAADGQTELRNLLGGQDQMLLLDSTDLFREHPLLELFELPFLYADRQQLHKVIDSAIGQQILRTLQQGGLKPLCYWDKSFRQLAADRPLLSPEQANGVEFNGRQSLLADVFQGKITHSRQQQGFEISLAELGTWHPDGSITDLTLSNHAATADLLLTSQAFWDSLPEDLKVIVSGAIKDATVYARELMTQADKQALQTQEDNGRFRLHQLTLKQRTVWQKTMLRVYRQHLSEKELHFIEMILRG